MLKSLPSIAKRSLTSLILALMISSPTSAAEIIFGQVGPLAGTEANQGRAYAVGVQLYFNQVNAAGGIAGNTLTLVSRDDAGNREQALLVTQQLVAEQRPIALTGYFGAANVSTLLASGLLEQEKIPLVGFRGAQVPKNRAFVYSVRAGLPEQLDKIVQHLATLGIQRLGLLYESGPQAASVLQFVRDSVAKRGLNVVAAAMQTPSPDQVTKNVRMLLVAQPQAILLQVESSGGPFVERYRAAGGTAQLFATADLDIEQLGQRIGETELAGISIAQVTPSPTKPTIRLTRDFQRAYQAEAGGSKAKLEGGFIPLEQRMAQRPMSHAMFEGYIAARVLVEAMRRAGANPTRASFIRALDSLERLDLGDYVISYQPGIHTGSSYVDLSIVGVGGKLRQ
ncbi:MAG: ABC transporter substrate-binding protein [Polaromonas sp.]|uniref:ABC transporter substrate-binding protein n=1 Tax=Polaromonas sp. TaxID=1869339 RepID=UPI002735F554|nr:ABC transporter substrate-binding protein [Polaromonas sp.]MDP3799771.1 ABC transporter substrate-binding protein [Polaromonas sp.]